MNDSILMEVLNTFHDLFKVFFRLLFIDFLFFLKERIKVTIFTQFSNDVHIVGGLVDIKEFNNVGMINFFHDLDFGLDVFDVVRVGKEAFINDFDSNILASLNDAAFVDVGV
jgi:hypothetical protein